ncbi:uncharacterized protein TNCV_2127291 [Trichonephila clavipes]|nr:uncharacterized protein TNCV_2127291 [Trichonephila clavipes]
MENRKETTIEERKLVIKLSNEGKSQRNIAKVVGRSVNCIQKILQKFKKTGQSVSAETVRRVLRKAGCNGRVARKKPLIGKRNRVKRLKFAKEHILKPQQFWNEVIFSDESKFNIFGSDGRRMVWRKPNTSHHRKHNSYCEVRRWVVMNGCFTIVGINLIPPLQSPDLNVIENLWSHLERAVKKYQITSKEQLKSVLQEEWLNIAPETTRHLVESMPRRLEAVISAKVISKCRKLDRKYLEREFYGNRFTKLALNSNNSTSASEAKLSTFDSFHVLEPEFHGSTGNRIINFQALMGIISILCCPECYATGLKLAEDSKEGLCSNLCVACSCGFMTGFTSTPKENKKLSLNTLLVFGLRLIGRGFTAGKKLLCTLNLPCISKNTFRAHEFKLLEEVQLCSEENMKAASKEVQNFKKSTTCGVSVDGSWQRRGHMSLNGCVSVISIDTGKILDLEVMTQYCKMCELDVKREHVCSNYKGSSGNMEAVGAFRIFERSLIKRDLQYTEYYGDGDSKGFLQVKDIYGENSVTKLECIGHIQKE